MIAEGLRARLGLTRDDDTRHAVIDIGSNTVRLVIYGGPPRAPSVLWNEKVSARLGRDLAKTGAIPEAAIDEALTALERFRAIIAELGIARVETVATAAAREASNGAEFVRRVREIGLSVEVLSGKEEARASAQGALGAFPNARGVVADLGGGSLELIEIGDSQCGQGASFPFGTLRLPELRAEGKLGGKVTKSLKGAEWARGGPLYMIGGTWRAFANYTMRRLDHPLTDPHGYVIGADAAAEIAKEVARAKPSQLAQQRGISAMRSDKLPDAAALLSVLLTELEPEALIFSSWGLREGLYFQALAASERALNPLLAGVVDFTEPRGGAHDEAELIAKWTAAAGRTSGAGSLRLAVAYLALALHRVEPNLRGAQALEWALDKRWIGIDFSGRAMLAAALRGTLGLTAPDPRIAPLASEGELREATAWGLAFRLAQRLGVGAQAPLVESRLLVDGNGVELRLAKRHAALAAGPVEKALKALADWLDLAPRLTITD